MPSAIPDKIPCESVSELEQEIATLREALSFPETEETWERIARALTRFGAVVKGGGYKFEKELIHGVKLSNKPIISAMSSERTRLSAAALDCISIIAPRLGMAFETLVPLFIPCILRLSARPNKVYVTRSQGAINLILGYCQVPSIVPHLLTACKESKIVTGRTVAIEGVLRCLNKWDWTQKDIKARVGDVEEVIRVTGRDKDAGIRQTSRKVFEAYKNLFPERIDEFTGPLTPVMKKYLDIKPPSQISNPLERTRLLSAQEKSKRPLVKSDLAASTSSVPSETSTSARGALGAHARSASSNAVASSVCTEQSHPGDAAALARPMPPPSNVPLHARSRSQTRSRQENRQEEQDAPHERQRVISSASSIYSVKSAPSTSLLNHTHRAPARLGSSKPPTTNANHIAAGSSGQARRVRKVANVEPHPANCHDVVHKAPVRPTLTSGASAPRATKSSKGPAREPVSGSGVTGVAFPGVAFPTFEPPPTERKGAQRVPKPALPPARIASPTSPKMDRPASATGVPQKREVKPSIFRRAQVDKKDGEKKEGFAPRRGGGLMQPTLSQLSKQRTPVKSTVARSTRGAPGVGGKGRGVVRAPPPKVAVKPATIPLPASPGREKEVVPQMVPLPESPKPTPREEPKELQAEERGDAAIPYKEQDEIILDKQEAEAPESEQKAVLEDEPEVPSPRAGAQPEVDPKESVNVTEVIDNLGVHEQEPDHMADMAAVQVQADVPPAVELPVEKDDVFVVQAVPPTAPHTPPFPSDSDSDEDELEAIEFTTRDAYGPDGVPIKTPRKVVGVTIPERNPLGEVVLNE